MLALIAWLSSPLGRYIVIIAAVASVFGAAYVKIRHDAAQEALAKEHAQESTDALRRLENAERAGNSVPTGPDRVFEHDRYERPDNP